MCLLAVLVAGAGVVGGGAVASQSAAESQECPPPNTRTVARSPSGAAFRRRGDDDALLACRFGARRPLLLSGGDDVQTHVRMAGRFVAVRDHDDSGSPDPCYGLSVSVFDLARTPPADPDVDYPLDPIYDETRFNCSGPSTSEDFNLPTSIVLKSNGAVAYIRCFSSDMPFGGPYRCRSDMPRQVIKHDASDARNHFTVLDVGAQITTQSLRLKRGRITWRNGSQLRSARLR